MPGPFSSSDEVVDLDLLYSCRRFLASTSGLVLGATCGSSHTRLLIIKVSAHPLYSQTLIILISERSP